METETVKTVKHTPVPWTYHLARMNEHDVEVFQIDQHDDSPTRYGKPEIHIADVFGDKATAEFIVRACNSHYELVEALKNLLPLAEDGYQRHNNNGCHEDFLKEDRTRLYEAREALKKATS